MTEMSVGENIAVTAAMMFLHLCLLAVRPVNMTGKLGRVGLAGRYPHA